MSYIVKAQKFTNAIGVKKGRDDSDHLWRKLIRASDSICSVFRFLFNSSWWRVCRSLTIDQFTLPYVYNLGFTRICTMYTTINRRCDRISLKNMGTRARFTAFYNTDHDQHNKTECKHMHIHSVSSLLLYTYSILRGVMDAGNLICTTAHLYRLFLPHCFFSLGQLS